VTEPYVATHHDPITTEIRAAGWQPRTAYYVCGCNPQRLCPQHASIRAVEHYHPELIP
jgi:hypothetical protein